MEAYLQYLQRYGDRGHQPLTSQVDVLIQHQVSANHALDFDQASDLITIGEETARHMLSAIKEAIEAPVEV